MAGTNSNGDRADRTTLVAALSSPDAYAHDVEQPIQVIETHISHLFLTGEYAYKVKKPVNLGFVDYSTLDLRRRFTELEFELNRQISPDVFLGIEPVVALPDGGFRVGGEGNPVEFALKMRQLSANRTFSNLLENDEIGPGEIRDVALLVARFHSAADAMDADSPLGGVEAMREVTADNLSVMGRFVGVTSDEDDLDDVSAYTSAFLDVNSDLLESRKAQGFVCDCHGDLHAGNLFLDHDGIHVIDRIEFNDRFRFIDVASDLAFLAMDLNHAGRGDLADVLIDSYVDETGDTGLPALLPFYVMHRSCVRCKVTSLLLDDQGEISESRRQEIIREASSYGLLAADTVASERPQAVYLMSGLMGSGKSTMADELSRRWGLERFTSDVVRKTLVGIDPQRVSDEDRREELYATEMSDRTYAEMIRLGGDALERGCSVLLDAAFIKRHHRADALVLAKDQGVPLYIVEVRAPDPVALARLRQRYESGESPSDGKPELLAWHRSELEPVSPEEADGHIVVENSGTIRDGAIDVLNKLWRVLLQHQPEQPRSVERPKRPPRHRLLHPTSLVRIRDPGRVCLR